MQEDGYGGNDLFPTSSVGRKICALRSLRSEQIVCGLCENRYLIAVVLAA